MDPNQTPPYHISGSVKLLLFALGILLVGGLGYLVWNQNNSPDAAEVNETPVPTTGSSSKIWTSVALPPTNTTVKIPTGWTVRSSELANLYPEQVLFYDIKTPILGGKVDGSIAVYNIPEWLKGPEEGDGYVLNKTERAGLTEVIKELYSTRQLTATIQEKLDKYQYEFMTYSSSGRIYIGYVESQDGKLRGLSMINTRGQDFYVETGYSTTLFNQEKNTLIKVSLDLSGKEIDDLNSRYDRVGSGEMARVDEEVHSAFAKLIKETPRSDLSFGDQMETVDLIAKSWQ